MPTPAASTSATKDDIYYQRAERKLARFLRKEDVAQ
jgi:hypothetical protein